MFTHLEGSGLYALHKHINHSCEPNAQIRFPFNNNKVQGKKTKKKKIYIYIYIYNINYIIYF